MKIIATHTLLRWVWAAKNEETLNGCRKRKENNSFRQCVFFFPPMSFFLSAVVDLAVQSNIVCVCTRCIVSQLIHQYLFAYSSLAIRKLFTQCLKFSICKNHSMIYFWTKTTPMPPTIQFSRRYRSEPKTQKIQFYSISVDFFGRFYVCVCVTGSYRSSQKECEWTEREIINNEANSKLCAHTDSIVSAVWRFVYFLLCFFSLHLSAIVNPHKATIFVFFRQFSLLFRSSNQVSV